MIVFKRTNLKILQKSIRNLSVKRKYPIDPEEAKTLPIFDYGVSKKEYRRIFAWGNKQVGALGVPFYKNTDEKRDRTFLSHPKRIYIGEKFEVTKVGCGFGFTAFAVNIDGIEKVYATGLNTDGQIGFHKFGSGKALQVIYKPMPIAIPFKDPDKATIIKIAAGRAHLLVLSNEGLWLLGNNSYGQCGRKIIENEDYIHGNFIHHISDLEGEKIVNIECGQDHSLAITESGKVFACGWGADGQTGLGHFNNCSEFTRVKGDIEHQNIKEIASRSDFVLALNDKGEIFGWGNSEYGQISTSENSQQVAHATNIKLTNIGKVSSVAAAGSFCLFSTESGEVYTWGFGLLGLGPNVEFSPKPKLIPSVLFGRNDFQPNSAVIKVRCGLSYACAVTNLGDLYTWGRNNLGCLGLNSEKDQFFPLRVALGGHVEDVCCGFDHTIAICKPFI